MRSELRPIRTRFAPSPTGFLHLGHAFAAITAHAAAAPGEFLLRQSTRSDTYRAALDKLERRGLVYPCFCTRRQIAEEIARSAEAPHGVAIESRYPGICRALTRQQRE